MRGHFWHVIEAVITAGVVTGFGLGGAKAADIPGAFRRASSRQAKGLQPVRWSPCHSLRQFRSYILLGLFSFREGVLRFSDLFRSPSPAWLSRCAMSGGFSRRHHLRGVTASPVPILLGARGPQPCQPIPAHLALPGKEFVHREQVARACFVKREQATTHGRDELGLAPYHPPGLARCRQISNSQRAAVWATHIFGPGS